MDQNPEAISLSDLSLRVASALTTPVLQHVWVQAETSDVRQSGPHCYLELVEKDPSGVIRAKARATIWGSIWGRFRAYFMHNTGSDFTSGLKVKVRVSANYHPAYGLTLNIENVDPTFTVGEAVRRRLEILARLEADGVKDLNRQVPWPRPALRVAVISAQNAAGYGDFVNQLFTSPRRIAFQCELFTAQLQGQGTAASVTRALDAIGARRDEFDAVVIIRGGGATTDLSFFDDYDLALHVANFPLPVIVGIGHERDVTVLDYVAAQRVKTPTAAAALLIDMATRELETIDRLASELYIRCGQTISDVRRQVDTYATMLPGLTLPAVQRATGALQTLTAVVGGAGARIIAPAQLHLEQLTKEVASAPSRTLLQAQTLLEAKEKLVQALAPHAVLARGFSVTRTATGAVVRQPGDASPGQTLTTTLANGTITSIVCPQP